ncbi:MAG TPA: 2-C-methyl-D-erythritol 4-phosphate cytidylyltransferase [Pyrinomonadaceae bacterium]|nr:2-C-methyl-D-erythritol 4-phosphate cytidylyltransferase [Pyrinomonadaceae bacterium]
MNVAIVVGGGKGVRFGGDRPKQFLELNGIPIIVHTLRQFELSRQIEKVVVVLPAPEVASFQSLVDKFDLKKIARVVAGGETRAQSVQNGLAAIDQAEVVAVHDAVRPLVTHDEIDRVVNVAAQSGAAILAAPVSETIKEVAGDQIVRTVARTQLRRALTPQSFRFELLKRAYQDLTALETSGVDVTDDSFLVERLGIPVTVVAGSAQNIKITSADDLAFAEVLVRARP